MKSLEKDLRTAATAGDTKEMARLIDQGAIDLNKALLSAIESGQTEAVKFLFERGADLRHDNDHPLRLACGKGVLATVLFLLENGADISAENDGAIKASCELNKQDITKALMERRDYEKENPRMALMAHSSLGNIDQVKKLLARPGIAQWDKDWALKYASANGQDEVIKLLISHGADINDEDEGSPLHWAADQGQAKTLRLLASFGVDVQEEDNAALRQAVFNDHLAATEALLDLGADIETNDGYCIITAASRGFFELASMLVKRGANVKRWNHEALRRSAHNRHKGIAALLMAQYESKELKRLLKDEEMPHKEINKELQRRASLLIQNLQKPKIPSGMEI
jgi:ankyrin repeat protein